MGTFAGHALPGGFFITFGLWWTVRMFQRYYKSVYTPGQRFKSSVTFPCPCHKMRLCQMEGLLKIIFCGIGIAGEMWTGMKGGKFVVLGNAQHCTMFAMFLFSGVTDILLHYRLVLLQGADYVIAIMALLVEGILFRYHVHGANDMERLLHELLIYVIMACVLMTTLEMCFRHQILAALGRAYCFLLQGTWFWQVGFILYNPLSGATPWDPENHNHLMIATMIFAWHIGINFILMLAIGGASGAYYRCHGDHNPRDYDIEMEPLIDSGDHNNDTCCHGNNNDSNKTNDAFLQ